MSKLLVTFNLLVDKIQENFNGNLIVVPRLFLKNLLIIFYIIISEAFD